MCDICLHSPCLRGCPNEEIPVYGVCRHCGDGIPVGSRYVDLGGDRLCEDCAGNMTLSELLEYLGYSLEENIPPEPDDWREDP